MYNDFEIEKRNGSEYWVTFLEFFKYVLRVPNEKFVKLFDIIGDKTTQVFSIKSDGKCFNVSFTLEGEEIDNFLIFLKNVEKHK